MKAVISFPLPSLLSDLSEFITTHISFLLSETTYNYEWSLLIHPADYQDEINQRHMQTLNLSQVRNWRLAILLQQTMELN